MRGQGAQGGKLSRDELLLARAFRFGPKSRAELAALMGWSRNTVAARLERLIEENVVLESDGEQGDRGRPFVRYGINPEASSIFVARFDVDYIDGFICALDGRIIASDRHELIGEPGAEGAVRELEAMLGRLAARPAVSVDKVSAMVVGVPGPVHDMTTVPWSGLGVLSPDLSKHFAMSVAVENDANLMALGTQADFRDVKSLIFLFVDRGIGAGIIVADELHRGVMGWGGEVGHIPILAAGDTPCSCGNRGCVASIASNPALIRAISTPSRPVETVDELRRLVQAGDTEAIMALRQAGRHIGDAIIGLTVGLAPDVIVVGGNIARVGDHMIAGIRESLGQKIPSAISSQIRIVASDGHDAAHLRGATYIGFDLLLAGMSGRN